MGFQFNEVGGGTRTRRPIALRMHYNAQCDEPQCYVRDERFTGGTPVGSERHATLEEVRAFVESENQRLERDAHRAFDAKQIDIRVEYRHCPNLVLIDTPGLISAVFQSDDDGVQHRAWRRAATEAYELALAKARHRDYILLCVEDTNDWKVDSIARRLCQQADPGLQRTVVVNTKLDTKLVQFSQRRDVQNFLKAAPLTELQPDLLAGPFFTSVPCGRVGRSSLSFDDEDDEIVFGHDAEFRAAVERATSADASLVTSRLGTDQFLALQARLGVAALRTFLEKHVESTYRTNVARVLPLLRAERLKAQAALRRCSEELERLSPQRLRRAADTVADKFCRALSAAVAGAVSAPPDEFGETLADERVNGGAFLAPDEEDVPSMPTDLPFEEEEDLTPQSRTKKKKVARGGFQNAPPKPGPSMALTLSQADLDASVGHADASLYGGAQYRRAIREFALAVRHLSLPEVRRDEIANALGVGDAHDGADFVRAACVIAVDKARRSFEPQLETLAVRATHVMRRLPPVLEYMMRARDGDAAHSNFLGLVSKIYDAYAQSLADAAVRRCKDDLEAMTRFVTWDLASTGDPKAAVKTALSPLPALATSSRLKSDELAEEEDEEARIMREWHESSEDAEPQVEVSSSDLVDALATATADMDDTPSSTKIVATLVKRIAAAWREHFARTVAIKFNCFFLVPFVDDFPLELRKSLDDVFDDDETAAEFFDLNGARKALELKQADLQDELDANTKLHDTFDQIQRACTNDQYPHQDR